jgi:NADH-quinone oxidoreductase subunit A
VRNRTSSSVRRSPSPGGRRGRADEAGEGSAQQRLHARWMPGGALWKLGSVRRRDPLGRRVVFDDWLPFLIYGLFALAIPSSMIAFSFILAQRPSQRVRTRGIPFESGVSQGPPRAQRFSVNFYLTAMLFILFDIEIVFLYPLAVILHELAWFGFLEFLVFLGILLLAYVYIWRKGALEWR